MQPDSVPKLLHTGPIRSAIIAAVRIANRHIGNRTVIIFAGIGVLVFVVYFVLIPVMVARAYTSRINTTLAQARSDLKSISTGQNVVVFQDPDITPAKRQALIARTLDSLKKAQASLDDVHTANTLLVLPGAGFIGPYHKAAVRYERANNAIGQSRQVLDAYTRTLTYINALTAPQLHLNEQLTYINSVRDFTALNGNGGVMFATAEQLQTDYNQLSSLTPPPEFKSLHNDTLQLLDQASVAFERLGQGLNQHSDAATYDAVTALERLTTVNDTYANNLTELAQNSPTLRQLVELPEKIEHVEGI